MKYRTLHNALALCIILCFFVNTALSYALPNNISHQQHNKSTLRPINSSISNAAAVKSSLSGDEDMPQFPGEASKEAIAQYYAAGRKHFKEHPEHLPEVVLPDMVNHKLDAHTYLRGCGTDMRNLVEWAIIRGELREFFSADELIKYIKEQIIRQKLPISRFNLEEIALIKHNEYNPGIERDPKAPVETDVKAVRGRRLLWGRQDWDKKNLDLEGEGAITAHERNTQFTRLVSKKPLYEETFSFADYVAKFVEIEDDEGDMREDSGAMLLAERLLALEFPADNGKGAIRLEKVKGYRVKDAGNASAELKKHFSDRGLTKITTAFKRKGKDVSVEEDTVVFILSEGELIHILAGDAGIITNYLASGREHGKKEKDREKTADMLNELLFTMTIHFDTENAAITIPELNIKCRDNNTRLKLAKSILTACDKTFVQSEFGHMPIKKLADKFSDVRQLAYAYGVNSHIDWDDGSYLFENFDRFFAFLELGIIDDSQLRELWLFKESDTHFLGKAFENFTDKEAKAYEAFKNYFKVEDEAIEGTYIKARQLSECAGIFSNLLLHARTGDKELSSNRDAHLGEIQKTKGKIDEIEKYLPGLNAYIANPEAERLEKAKKQKERLDRQLSALRERESNLEEELERIEHLMDGASDLEYISYKFQRYKKDKDAIEKRYQKVRREHKRAEGFIAILEDITTKSKAAIADIDREIDDTQNVLAALDAEYIQRQNDIAMGLLGQLELGVDDASIDSAVKAAERQIAALSGGFNQQQRDINATLQGLVGVFDSTAAATALKAAIQDFKARQESGSDMAEILRKTHKQNLARCKQDLGQKQEASPERLKVIKEKLDNISNSFAAKQKRDVEGRLRTWTAKRHLTSEIRTVMREVAGLTGTFKGQYLFIKGKLPSLEAAFPDLANEIQSLEVELDNFNTAYDEQTKNPIAERTAIGQDLEDAEEAIREAEKSIQEFQALRKEAQEAFDREQEGLQKMQNIKVVVAKTKEELAVLSDTYKDKHEISAEKLRLLEGIATERAGMETAESGLNSIEQDYIKNQRQAWRHGLEALTRVQVAKNKALALLQAVDNNQKKAVTWQKGCVLEDLAKLKRKSDLKSAIETVESTITDSTITSLDELWQFIDNKLSGLKEAVRTAEENEAAALLENALEEYRERERQITGQQKEFVEGKWVRLKSTIPDAAATLVDAETQLIFLEQEYEKLRKHTKEKFYQHQAALLLEPKTKRPQYVALEEILKQYALWLRAYQSKETITNGPALYGAYKIALSIKREFPASAVWPNKASVEASPPATQTKKAGTDFREKHLAAQKLAQAA